ncbi:MAG TPA: TonB-dependent receptor [Phenylobacterium sp.]|uniref:TonB-dependent receptor n=1 Tax=Phenylobacterium sp. TaxID=1871053 RepID=UPI002D4CCFC1|nr:TonB-dependent receptor [Phenylobacterium sp.]HZZ69764.1 TonB-dependent receptor [Phenylobacterium sp.]
MRLRQYRALCATTALATGLLVASGALAQSTATQVQELVVTGARGMPSIAGAISQVQEAKDESVVNHEFFERQQAGQNFAQLINLLPGVNYSSEDQGGNLSGDLRIHGFDGNHISVTIDGSPVNDTGNYAIFPGEYLVPELTDHITVNMGATSVDSPTASAVGGSVDIVTKVPTTDPQLIVQPTVGSNDFTRYYVEGDTGSFGPWGTRFYLAGNYDHYDKWVGAGDEMREGVDFRIYQPLKGSDFVSLSGSYVLEHDYFFDTSSPAQFDQAALGVGKNNLDYNTQWARPTAVFGQADTPPMGTGPLINKGSTPGFNQGNDPFGDGLEGNYWALHPNPVIFGQVRGASKFSLTDKLTFTFDPSFFYTLANGGGVFSTFEGDPRLKGNCLTCKGVDLNGDGDTLDTVNLYGPSNTNTHRWLVSSSLLYDLNENNHFALAYTLDYGQHRQTGEFGFIDPMTGMPGSIFGGKSGAGSTQVHTDDGSILRTRDRFSIAELNQISGNYLGKFFDDKLHINIGIRAPFFKRELNQFCYTYNGTSAYCDTIDPALVKAAFNAGVAAGNSTALSLLLFGPKNPLLPVAQQTPNTTISFDPLTKAPNFRAPFSQTFNYNHVLPNAGATYRVTDNQLVYVTYSQAFSAPKTDDLYSSSTAVVQPETSNTYAAGWRYQSGSITTSFSAWDTDYKNRIVQSFDPTDPTLSIDRNIGEVNLYGIDLEAGAHPMEHLSLYGSAEVMRSDVQSNETVSAVSGVAFALPTKGKELVLTPDTTISGRAQYDFGWMSAGLQVKYSSRRYVDDMNTTTLPDYTTVNFDARLPITWWGAHDTYLQFAIYNITNTRYPVRTSSVSNANNVIVGNTTLFGKSFFYTYDSPRTAQVTLHATF